MDWLWTWNDIAPFGINNCPSFIGHSGMVEGFTSYYAYNKELNIGFAYSINTETNLKEINETILKYIVQNYKSKSNAIKINISNYINYCGTYEFCNFRNKGLAFIEVLAKKAEIKIKDDKLYLRESHKPLIHIIPISINSFRLEFDQEPTIALKDEDGHKILLTNGGLNYYTKDEIHKIDILKTIVIFSLIISLTIFPILIILLILRIFKKFNNKILYVSCIPFAAVLSLCPLLLTIVSKPFSENMGSITWQSIMVLIGNISFGFLSIITFWFAINKNKISEKKAFNIYYIILGISLISLAFYLLWFKVIGLIPWT